MEHKVKNMFYMNDETLITTEKERCSIKFSGQFSKTTRNLNFPAKTDFSRNFSFLIFRAKNDTILVRKIMKILNFCAKIAISSNLFQYLNFRAKIQFTNYEFYVF